jgi:Tfp pilus assembly protein FimT
MELLIVIAILAIVLGLGAPNISEWNCKRGLKKDFDVVVGVLSTARVEAISRKSTVVVTAHPGYSGIPIGIAYGVSSNGSCNSISANRVQEITGVAPSNNTMCFKPDGDANNINSGQFFEVGKVCGSSRQRHRYKATITSFGHIIKEYLPPGGAQWLEI